MSTASISRRPAFYPPVEGGELLPLSCLMAGQRAWIRSIVGSQELVRHLEELGLRAGAALEMVRPGSTCILRIDGSKFCVRGDELLSVMVTPFLLGVANP